MRIKYVIFLTLFPILALSQKLKCCSSTDEVIENMEGIWEMKEPVHSIFYQFTFDGINGNLTILEKPESTVEFEIVNDHPFVEIVPKRRGFKLKITDLLESWESKILDLSKTTLILKTKGKRETFLKH